MFVVLNCHDLLLENVIFGRFFIYYNSDASDSDTGNNTSRAVCSSSITKLLSSSALRLSRLVDEIVDYASVTLTDDDGINTKVSLLPPVKSMDIHIALEKAESLCKAMIKANNAHITKVFAPKLSSVAVDKYV